MENIKNNSTRLLPFIISSLFYAFYSGVLTDYVFLVSFLMIPVAFYRSGLPPRIRISIALGYLYMSFWFALFGQIDSGSRFLLWFYILALMWSIELVVNFIRDGKKELEKESK